MKILGILPRPRTFEELLVGLNKSPHRRRLLQTSYASGFYSDGVVLSRMTYEEKKIVSKVHWDTIASDSKYAKSDPLEVRKTLPKFLGVEVGVVKSVNNGSAALVLLEGGNGILAVVDAQAFSTTIARHPYAAWRFSGGSYYWRKPLVLIESGGFEEGVLLAVVASIPMEPKKEIEGNKELVRSTVGNQWCYVKPENI